MVVRIAGFAVLVCVCAAPAAELTLAGNGASAETKYSEKYRVKRFTPYRLVLEAKKAGAKTAGRTLCAGLPGLNLDLDLEEDWTSHSGIFVTPSSKRRTRLRQGPNFDDPVGSVRGEMLRDGIEDFEYFAILKKLDPSNPLLKVPTDVSKALDDFSKSPAGIERHRRLLAREIERLSSRAPGS